MEFYNKINKMSISDETFPREMFHNTNIISLNYNNWKGINFLMGNIILRNISFTKSQKDQIQELFYVDEPNEFFVKDEGIYFNYKGIKDLESINFSEKIINLLLFLIENKFIKKDTKIGFFLNEFGDTFEGYDFAYKFLE